MSGETERSPPPSAVCAGFQFCQAVSNPVELIGKSFRQPLVLCLHRREVRPQLRNFVAIHTRGPVMLGFVRQHLSVKIDQHTP